LNKTVIFFGGFLLNTEKSIKIISRIEGTLISDLRSIKIIAEERNNSDLLKNKYPGGLNFTIFISSLIACETLGYFIKSNSDAGRSKENITNFISSDYFEGSAFKKDNYLDLLVSLRTNLAHVFGMTDLGLENINKELVLCVGDAKQPEVKRENGLVKLNGIKFLDLVVRGFDSIKKEVTSNSGNSKIINIISEKADKI